MTINGVNQFGSLTTKTGQVLNFEDFDKNGDGKISEQEYSSVLETYKLDSVELSTVYKNSDKEISKEEFEIWQQEIEMQNALNELKGQLAIDFAGEDDKYANQVMSELKEFLESFVSDYGNENIGDMADKFKEALPAKYAEIKDKVLSNTDSAISSAVIEEIFASLTEGADLSKDTEKTIYKVLDSEASKFIANYKGDNLKQDLTNHLIEYMNGSDAQKLSDATATWNTKKNSYGVYIDNNEFKKLKEDATEFLKEAIDKGVVITLKGTVIRTETAIKTALSKFTDGEELATALDEAISNLSTASKMDGLTAADNEAKAKAEEEAKAEEKAEKDKENATLIDTVIDKLYNELTADVVKENNGLSRMFHGKTTTISMPDETKQAIGEALESEAQRFLAAYEGTDFTADLEQHLRNYMNSSDSIRMSGAVNNWNTVAAKYTGYLSSNDFANLKEDVTTLLKAAIEQGVTISLGGVDVKSENDITSALSKFKDAKSLLNAVNDAVKNISSKTKIEQIVEAKKAEAEAKAEAEFVAIKGEEYQVDSSQIDHSKIANYGTTKKSNRLKARNDIREYLSQDGIKFQIKSQIKAMLESKGVPFSQISTVFENVYEQSIGQMINFRGFGEKAVQLSDGTKIPSGIKIKIKTSVDTTQLLESFVKVFNDNIAKAVNDMNATNTDIDLTDIDYSVISIGAEGDNAAQEIDEAFEKGTNYTVQHRLYTVQKNLENMFIQINAQMLAKARAMCQANGVEFNNQAFETAFNNAKITATNGAIGYKAVRKIGFNPRSVITTFTTEFKTNYTAWVDSQKSKTNV